jgi:hypothetical protein
VAGKGPIPKIPFDWDRITAISALIVSVTTVVFLGYQTLLMRTQVEASIWPYVQIATSCCGEGFSVNVQNKGVGPAIIKYAYVRVDGKPQRNWREVIVALTGQASTDFSVDSLTRRVMAANDDFKAFSIKSPDLALKVATEAAKGRLKGEVCYCSVLHQCWLATNDPRVQDRGACPETEPSVTFGD